MKSVEEVVEDVLEEAALAGLAVYVEGRENARGVAGLLVERLRSEGLLREGTIGQRTRGAILEAARSSALSRSSSLEERANVERRAAGHG